MRRLALAVVVVAALVLGLGYMGYTGYFLNGGPAQYDSLAQCLTDSGAVMYGAYWCPHCNNQKAMFGSSVKYINYVECDQNGPDAQPELCQEMGITGYPTWIINGKQYRGEQSLESLASATGCEL